MSCFFFVLVVSNKRQLTKELLSTFSLVCRLLSGIPKRGRKKWGAKAISDNL